MKRGRMLLAAGTLGLLPPLFTDGVGGSPALAATAPDRSIAEAARALRSGRYEHAMRAARARLARAPDDTEALIVAAQAEAAVGLYQEARRRLETAAADRPDDLPLRDALMRLLETIGDRDALAPLIDASYADWNAGRVARSRAADLRAIATATRLDRNWKDANDVLREAVRADRKATGANLDWGAILLEKHNAADAEAAFKDVLALDPDNPDGHFGLARVAVVDRYDAATARDEIRRVLATNPLHAGALALRAELALDAEDWAAARADVATLRKTNPRDPGATRIAATAAILLDDRAGYARERDQHLRQRAGDGGFFAFVAEALSRHRRYDEAREVAGEGVAADGQNAAALSALASALLRLGQEDEGLTALRRAWKSDPYDVRTFNLLNLFEKVIAKSYVTVETAHLRFRVPPAARTAIIEVVGPYLDERFLDYVARYGFTPVGPITFELFAEQREFAVRTVGLPTIGVAGVCFGRVITSQVPTNHAFNWGMVLAHELAHVFAMQASRARVPRWFTEGLSEVETMRARPEWARNDDIALYGAWHRGELPTLVDLSNAFINARNGDDAVRAYAHAALAIDFLERRFGFAAIRSALAAYGRGERGAPVLEKITGLSAADLEKAFRAELATRFQRYERQYLPSVTLHPGASAGERPTPPGRGAGSKTVREAARTGLAALEGGDLRSAEKALERARAFPRPSIADQADTLFLTGEIALARRNAEAAIAAFQGLLALDPPRHDGYDVRVRLALAEIHRKGAVAAAAHLQRAIELDPTRVEPHALLAELYGEQRRANERVAALEAAVRLDPQTDGIAKEVVFAHAKAGRSERVVELAQIAIFIDPADADLHASLGRALAATGKLAPAAAALERALLFGAHDPVAIHASLAALYDRLGQGSKAASHRAAARR